MVVFIGQLCQPTQNCVETKLSKLSLLSQLKPLLKLFSSASKASYKSFQGDHANPTQTLCILPLLKMYSARIDNIMYPGAQDWIVPNDLQTKFLFKCQAMALILGMPVISNYRNNSIKIGHHQKRAINNCPLLFSYTAVLTRPTATAITTAQSRDQLNWEYTVIFRELL